MNDEKDRVPPICSMFNEATNKCRFIKSGKIHHGCDSREESMHHFLCDYFKMWTKEKLNE